VQIDPWGSSQYQDYARLREQFGIEAFTQAEWSVFPDPHPLLRRGVVFGQRDFARVTDAIKGHDPWSVMTGFMPSGDMHMGHKMVIDQVVAHQDAGADVHVAVADFEAVAARGLSLEKARALALDQYIRNYLALGLDPERAEVYYQTLRRRVRDLADCFALKVNHSMLQALYGFRGQTTLAHMNAPVIQAADILHVQQDEQGPRPVLVPVGVDQDPHIRFTRDIADAWRRLRVTTQNTASREGGDEVVVTVSGGDDVKLWLDLAEGVLDGLGIGTRTSRKRNEPHGQIVVGRLGQMTAKDLREIDLALAQAEVRGKGIRNPMALVRPSATFHRFMTGLTGDKMSSSRPETSVFLTETPEAAAAKLKRSVTGGRATAEEQRRIGAEPDKCPVYEMYLYHLAKDDAHLQTVHDECKGGQRLCGGCKGEAIELLSTFLREHKERRDETAHLADAIVAKE
jgi:tryptophanyl-tRNA synthetase